MLLIPPDNFIEFKVEMSDDWTTFQHRVLLEAKSVWLRHRTPSPEELLQSLWRKGLRAMKFPQRGRQPVRVECFLALSSEFKCGLKCDMTAHPDITQGKLVRVLKKNIHY